MDSSMFDVTTKNPYLGFEIISHSRFTITADCHLRSYGDPCAQSWEIAFDLAKICHGNEEYIIRLPAVEKSGDMPPYNDIAIDYLFDVRKVVCGAVLGSAPVKARIEFMDSNFSRKLNHTAFSVNEEVYVQLEIFDSPPLSRSAIKELAFVQDGEKQVLYGSTSYGVNVVARDIILKMSPETVSTTVIRWSIYLDSQYFGGDKNGQAQVSEVHIDASVILEFDVPRRRLHEDFMRRELSTNEEEIGYNFGLDFHVIPFRCTAPYADPPGILPGSYHWVKCESQVEEWMVFCDEDGWDLDESRNTCGDSYNSGGASIEVTTKENGLLMYILFIIMVGFSALFVTVIIWYLFVYLPHHEEPKKKLDPMSDRSSTIKSEGASSDPESENEDPLDVSENLGNATFLMKGSAPCDGYGDTSCLRLGSETSHNWHPQDRKVARRQSEMHPTESKVRPFLRFSLDARLATDFILPENSSVELTHPQKSASRPCFLGTDIRAAPPGEVITELSSSESGSEKVYNSPRLGSPRPLIPQASLDMSILHE